MFLGAFSMTFLAALVFLGLVFMSNRPRGTVVAQGIFAVAAAAMFVALVTDRAEAQFRNEWLAGFAVAVMAAAVAGMLYHLYLGRFESVWAARFVFAAVYLFLSGLFGFVFLSVI